MKDEVFAKSLNYNGSSWQELIEHFQSENLDYGLQGIVIYNQKGERTKAYGNKTASEEKIINQSSAFTTLNLQHLSNSSYE